MAAAFCPNCGCKIVVNKPKLENFIECPDCQEELEITRVKPFELDFAYGDYVEPERDDDRQRRDERGKNDAKDEWNDTNMNIGTAGFFKKEMKLM